MRSKCIILLATAASIVWVRGSASASVSHAATVSAPTTSVAPENSSGTKVNGPGSGRTQVGGRGLTAKESVTEILGCLGRRWYSDKDECYKMFLTFWNNYSDEDPRCNGIAAESKKSKKQLWNVKNLMLGTGVKLILFLPIFAILAGKAISLSLTSLLITSLAFIYNSQFNSFVKRGDFN